MESQGEGDSRQGLAFPKARTVGEGSGKASGLECLGSREDLQGIQQEKQTWPAGLRSLTYHCSLWGVKNFHKDKGATVIISSQSSFDTPKVLLVIPAVCFKK